MNEQLCVCVLQRTPCAKGGVCGPGPAKARHMVSRAHCARCRCDASTDVTWSLTRAHVAVCNPMYGHTPNINEHSLR